jgi:hypothetical protein
MMTAAIVAAVATVLALLRSTPTKLTVARHKLIASARTARLHSV